jgi:hypothetical protein
VILPTKHLSVHRSLLSLSGEVLLLLDGGPLSVSKAWAVVRGDSQAMRRSTRHSYMWFVLALDLLFLLGLIDMTDGKLVRLDAA